MGSIIFVPCQLCRSQSESTNKNTKYNTNTKFKYKTAAADTNHQSIIFVPWQLCRSQSESTNTKYKIQITIQIQNLSTKPLPLIPIISPSFFCHGNYAEIN